MGQRRERRLAARDRLHRGSGLDDLVAGAAAILGADGAHDSPLDGHGVEHLVAILAQRTQSAAALRTGAAALLGLDPLLLARQVGRERADRQRPLCADRIDTVCAGLNSFGLELFER